jgi:hypothetical protein
MPFSSLPHSRHLPATFTWLLLVCNVLLMPGKFLPLLPSLGSITSFD